MFKKSSPSPSPYNIFIIIIVQHIQPRMHVWLCKSNQASNTSYMWIISLSSEMRANISVAGGGLSKELSRLLLMSCRVCEGPHPSAKQTPLLECSGILLCMHFPTNHYKRDRKICWKYTAQQTNEQETVFWPLRSVGLRAVQKWLPVLTLWQKQSRSCALIN